jgi:hypothetical protein
LSSSFVFSFSFSFIPFNNFLLTIYPSCSTYHSRSRLFLIHFLFFLFCLLPASPPHPFLHLILLFRLPFSFSFYFLHLPFFLALAGLFFAFNVLTPPIAHRASERVKYWPFRLANEIRLTTPRSVVHV